MSNSFHLVLDTPGANVLAGVAPGGSLGHPKDTPAGGAEFSRSMEPFIALRSRGIINPWACIMAARSFDSNCWTKLRNWPTRKEEHTENTLF
jgi:hypothetical protein